MTALLVLITILIFIGIDYLVYRKKGVAILQGATAIIKEQEPTPVKVKNIYENDILFPKGVFLHPNHTWAHISQSGKVKIGIDDFISKVVGQVDRVILPELGAEVKQGKPFFSINSNNKKLDFVSPVNGKVVAINNDLLENPAMMKDPYKSGWSIIVEPKNILADITNLKIADDGINWLKSELRRFREFLTGLSNGKKLAIQTLPDGGLPAVNVLSLLDENQWEKFQNEFLTVKN